MHLDRRSFLLTAAATLGAPPCVRALAANATADGGPRPTPAQLAWQDAELGVIFHFDLPVAAGVFAPNNAVRRRLDPRQYQPAELDTAQWVAAAQAAGARYAIFTATHFNGFLQWQSDLYPYGVKQTTWRNGQGDVVADFVASCHRKGILPGLYFSTHRNAYWDVWAHFGDGAAGRGSARQAEYNRVAERMTEELCSRYGPLLQIWYDAGVKTPEEGGPDVLPVFAKHQPDAVFYHNRRRADHRWIGNEDGYAGDPCWATMPGGAGRQSHNSPDWRPRLLHGDPDGQSWSPGMVDVPLRGAAGVHSWLWMPGQEHGCHPTARLLDMYDQSVGRNCNFVIGAVVAPNGLVPGPDVARLEDLGRALARRERRLLARTGGEGPTLELCLRETATVDRIALMEEISRGERIRSYAIEAREPGRDWREIATGRSVGHKRIHAFAATAVDALRLRVIAARGMPLLRDFAVYRAGDSTSRP
jgi:alpha-L-fucosidase